MSLALYKSNNDLSCIRTNELIELMGYIWRTGGGIYKQAHTCRIPRNHSLLGFFFKQRYIDDIKEEGVVNGCCRISYTYVIMCGR